MKNHIKLASVSVMCMALSATICLAAGGLQSIPYPESFESYPASYAITNVTGWQVAREVDVALVTNMNSATSPYFDGESDLRVLDISGTVTVNFEKNETDEYFWLDLLVRPQCRENPPVLTRPYPQIAAYVNNDERLVIFHSYWDPANPQDEDGSYQKYWITNDTAFVRSNQWSRLTFQLDYTDSVYLDGYYSCKINDGALFTNSTGYFDTEDNFEPDAGAWFMCANLPQFSRGFVSNLTVAGTCQIDLLGMMTNEPAPPPPGDRTLHGVPYEWIASYYGVVDYAAQELTDLDGDGMLCWEEYWAGTNPEDSGSILQILQVGSDWKVTWQGGTNQDNYDFKIWRCTNLAIGTWTDYSNRQRAAAATQEYTDPDGSNHPVMFYKITAPTNSP